jgi:hypothetical protein
MGDEDMKDLLHKKLMDVFDKEYPPHKYVPRNDNDLKNYIISLTPFLHPNSNISERLYCIKNNVNPICKNGKQRSFVSFYNGYRNGCASGTNCQCSQESRSLHTTQLNKIRQVELLEKQKIAFFNRLIEKCKENNIDALFTIDDYEGIKKVYKWKCNICNHAFEKHIDKGLHPICKNCFPVESNSKEQDEIYDWIRTIYKGVILKNVRGILDYGLEIDIYIPDLNIGIEYNGNYYHSENFGRIDKEYHKRKISLAYDKGIKLLSFFSDEWKHNQNNVKSLITHNMGMHTGYIHARKAQVKKISWANIKDFIDKYHLQGSGRPTNMNYGLFYENELISVMTFSITSKHDCDYELVRFCSSKRVNGGASKLFKQFTKEFSPKSILSYNDNRIGNGTVYHSLGFEFINNTKPGYFWVDKNSDKRLSRTKFTKKILVEVGYDPSKTEDEIMKDIGYLKIYDAGHRIFKWTNK